MSYNNQLTVLESPLALDGWLAWNQEMWNLVPRRVVYAPKGKELPRLEGVLYLDRKGRVRMPPRNPYLPFRFFPTATDRPDRLYRQWLEVCGSFADELVQRGIFGTISLSPGFMDGRPYQWRGLEVSVRYTFVANLPVDEEIFDASIRNKVKKARKLGYYVERSQNWDSITACLDETGKEKSFSHRTDSEALCVLQEKVGDESFRGYVGYDDKGNVVSGGLRLHLPGGISIDWSQGTVRSELRSGINQLLYWKVLEDLTEANAAVFDLAGANIPPVAAAKAAWGFPLVPYLTIRASDLRHLVRTTFQVGKWLFGARTR